MYIVYLCLLHPSIEKAGLPRMERRVCCAVRKEIEFEIKERKSLSREQWVCMHVRSRRPSEDVRNIRVSFGKWKRKNFAVRIKRVACSLAELARKYKDVVGVQYAH